MDEYKFPKILPCHHTFCLPCLESVLDATQKLRPVRLSNFPCPTCRKTCYLPADGLNGLATDFKVTQVRELMQKIGAGNNDESSEETIDCSICQFRGLHLRANQHCTECNKNLCDKCARQHEVNPLFDKHTTTLIERLTVDASTRPSKCRDHKESLLYFCEQCERSVCSVCVLTDHNGHAVQNIDKAPQIQNQILSKKLNQLLEIPTRITHQRQLLADIRSRQSNILAASKAALVSASESAKRAIDLQVTELTEQLVKSNIEQEYEMVKYEEKLVKDMEETETMIGRMRSFVDTLCTKGKDFEALNKEVRELMSRAQAEEMSDRLKRCVIFASVEPDKIRPMQLGNMKETNISDASQIMQNVKITTEDHTRKEFITADKRQLIPSISSQISSSVTQVTSLENNVTSRDNNDVIIVSNNTEPRICTINGFKQCRSVCFTSTGELVATDNVDTGDRVKMFGIDGGLLRKLNGSIVVRPWAVCYDDYSSSIIITDHGHSPLKILKSSLTTNDISMLRCGMQKASGIGANRQGEYIITDTGSPSPISAAYAQLPMGRITKLFEFGFEGEGKLVSPNYLAVDHHGRILVSDCAQGVVKVFDSAGKFLHKFGGEENQNFVPQGLTVDENNNILLADQSQGRVLRFNSDGRLIETVVEHVDNPWGIGYDCERHILAICTDKKISLHPL